MRSTAFIKIGKLEGKDLSENSILDMLKLICPQDFQADIPSPCLDISVFSLREKSWAGSTVRSHLYTVIGAVVRMYWLVQGEYTLGRGLMAELKNTNKGQETEKQLGGYLEVNPEK